MNHLFVSSPSSVFIVPGRYQKTNLVNISWFIFMNPLDGQNAWTISSQLAGFDRPGFWQAKVPPFQQSHQKSVLRWLVSMCLEGDKILLDQLTSPA